jgi:ATP-dependent protease ClpP protease subunit
MEGQMGIQAQELSLPNREVRVVRLIGEIRKRFLHDLDDALTFGQDVEIRINSVGGDPTAAVRAAAVIDELAKEGLLTRAVGIGRVHGSAFKIFMHCQSRIARENSTFKITERLIEGRPVTEADHKEFEEFLKYLSKKTSLPLWMLKQWANQGREFKAKEAHQYFFADCVIKK